MEKVFRIFNSFEEADAADCEADRAMTPAERIGVVLALRSWTRPEDAEQRLSI